MRETDEEISVVKPATEGVLVPVPNNHVDLKLGNTRSTGIVIFEVAKKHNSGCKKHHTYTHTACRCATPTSRRYTQ